MLSPGKAISRSTSFPLASSSALGYSTTHRLRYSCSHRCVLFPFSSINFTFCIMYHAYHIYHFIIIATAYQVLTMPGTLHRLPHVAFMHRLIRPTLQIQKPGSALDLTGPKSQMSKRPQHWGQLWRLQTKPTVFPWQYPSSPLIPSLQIQGYDEVLFAHLLALFSLSLQCFEKDVCHRLTSIPLAKGC